MIMKFNIGDTVIIKEQDTPLPRWDGQRGVIKGINLHVIHPYIVRFTQLPPDVSEAYFALDELSRPNEQLMLFQ
jgi:hypothetical protein